MACSVLDGLTSTHESSSITALTPSSVIISEEDSCLSTSGSLSITALSEGFDSELKTRFCGVHFFNPPRYMHLVELIPTAATQPEILDQLEGFLVTTLGKGVVRAKDTPNFIANRVGVFSMLATMFEAQKFGLSCDVVDDLTGSKLGRAKSGTFRTADVVGLDTLGHVIKTMQDTLPDDPFATVYQTPAVLAGLIGAGALAGERYRPELDREPQHHLGDQCRGDLDVRQCDCDFAGQIGND